VRAALLFIAEAKNFLLVCFFDVPLALARSPTSKNLFRKRLLARKTNIKRSSPLSVESVFYSATLKSSQLFKESKRLILLRENLGLALGVISTLVFYGALRWIVSGHYYFGAITFRFK